MCAFRNQKEHPGNKSRASWDLNWTHSDSLFQRRAVGEGSPGPQGAAGCLLPSSGRD